MGTLMSVQTVVALVPSIDLCKTNATRAGKSMRFTLFKGEQLQNCRSNQTCV